MKSRMWLSLTLVAIAILSLIIPAASSAARPQSSETAPNATAEQVHALMEQMNAELELTGAEFRVDYAEYITADDANEAGQIVFFRNRGNKQLFAHFVPGDPRRGGRTDINYLVDQTEGAIDGLTTAQTTAAIDRAMATWNGANCSVLPITKLADLPNQDLGVIEFILRRGGLPFPLADITHAGWLPAGVLPPNVIGVTFTSIFVSSTGVPTDINNDNKADVAFREILYNDRFVWRINGNIDVETVALHEAGHGLSQGHFGELFFTPSNGRIHFAPRAVMNAGYTGVQQSLAGSDNAGHCSIWGSWPNN